MEKFPELIIALVDDDNDNHYIFQDAFSRTGFKAEFLLFNSGIGFIEYIADQSNVVPHLVFLDINMPVLDGKKCIAPIKSHLHYYDTPIVMLTSSSSETDIEECFQSGANRYFIKPTTFQEMVDTLTQVLESYYNNTLQPHIDEFVLAG
jgi:CheY-like chemotaxis protein